MSSTQNETVPPPMFSPQVISDTNPDFSQNQDSPSSSPTTPPTVPPPPITPPPASLPTAPPSIVDFESYAHQGNPSNLNSFNWGGFLWGWLWGICNGVYWTLISIIFVIVCVFCAFMTEEGVMPRELSYAFLIITPFVDFVVRIILGISGYQMAWKSKHYESAEKFVKIQKKWTKAGVILFIISVGIVMGLLLMES
jgi:hypothetical protein